MCSVGLHGDVELEAGRHQQFKKPETRKYRRRRVKGRRKAAIRRLHPLGGNKRKKRTERVSKTKRTKVLKNQMPFPKRKSKGGKISGGSPGQRGEVRALPSKKGNGGARKMQKNVKKKPVCSDDAL